MGSEAPVPGGGTGDEPNYGFSVLDLTKHAALTILETLDERDRLGIVTFGSSARVLRELEVMTESNKAACKEAILCMNPHGLTNLWGGMLEGLALFDEAERQEGRLPAMMVCLFLRGRIVMGMVFHQCKERNNIELIWWFTSRFLPMGCRICSEFFFPAS